VLLLPWNALAQLRWSELEASNLPEVASHALAYDSARERLVLFGGSNWQGREQDWTWEWDGRQWTQRFPLVRPPARYGGRMVYDEARGVVVLFGGAAQLNQVRYADTWEWNGSTWTQRSFASSPGPRMDHGLAYDRARSRVVLHGGYDPSSTLLGDTWEYDGTSWIPRNTFGVGPSNRALHAMAYDPVRQRTVLFGGHVAIAGAPLANDLWEWSGTSWTARSSALRPSGRFEAELCFDSSSGAMHLYGGEVHLQTLSDHWVLGASGWTARTTSLGPRRGHRMAFVSGHGVCIVGGFDGQRYRNELARALATEWSVWPRRPQARRNATLMNLGMRGDVFLFGGRTAAGLSDETWILGAYDHEWSSIAPTRRPSAREHHAMAQIPGSNSAVIFGGSNATLLGDTWSFDGTNYRDITNAMAPAARDGHALHWHPGLQAYVLFGGRGAGGVRNDTWLLRGPTWSQLQPSASPSARADHAMAVEVSTGNLVLFGGRNAAGQMLDDTWIFDGTTWSELQPARRPTRRIEHTLTWDPMRDRLVLYGGTSSTGELADVWEWNGATWIPRTTQGAPVARTNHAAIYDHARGSLLVFGGEIASPAELLGGTHWLRPTVVGTTTALGWGCSDRPELVAFGAPCIGTPRFGMEVQRTQVGVPAILVLDTSYAALPIGACTLFVPGFQLQFAGLTSASRSARFDLPIPFDPVLRGAQIDAQALVLYSGGALFGSLDLSVAQRIAIGE
jgi:hypothetical protein